MNGAEFPAGCSFDVLREPFDIKITRSEFESWLDENEYSGLACYCCGLINCPHYQSLVGETGVCHYFNY